MLQKDVSISTSKKIKTEACMTYQKIDFITIIIFVVSFHDNSALEKKQAFKM